MPRRAAAVPPGERLGLVVTPVGGVVAATVGEVDATDERDVPARVLLVAHDHELLVVAAQGPDPLVEQHLAPGVVDRLGQVPVLLGREAEVVEVGPPHESLHQHTPASRGRQRLHDGGPVVGELLVRVAPPVGDDDQVAGSGARDRLGQCGEVGPPVHERAHAVALGPRPDAGPVVAPLLGGEEPRLRGVPGGWSGQATHRSPSCPRRSTAQSFPRGHRRARRGAHRVGGPASPGSRRALYAVDVGSVDLRCSSRRCRWLGAIAPPYPMGSVHSHQQARSATPPPSLPAPERRDHPSSWTKGRRGSDGTPLPPLRHRSVGRRVDP